jgi:hypothetical protein
MDGHVNPYASPADPSQALPLVAEVVVDDRGWTIDYELTVEDLVRWNQYFLRTSPTMRRQFWTAWLALGAAFFCLTVILPQLFMPGPSGWVNTAITAPIAVALWLSFPWFYRFKGSRNVRGLVREGAELNVVGRRRLSLSPEFIVYSTPLSQTVSRWQAIERIAWNRDALYIMLASNSALSVPRRAFASEVQFQQFVERATEFHAESNQPRLGGIPA